MPNRLQGEEVRAVKHYVNLRFSHWDRVERKRRVKQVIRRLKKEPQATRSNYVALVIACMERHGLDNDGK